MAQQYTDVFAQTDVLRLFPTFVWKAELQPQVHESVNGDILCALTGMRVSLPELVPGQPWQSSPDLHKLPAFSELLSCCDQAIVNVMDFLKIAQRAFEITGAWANMNPPNAAHQMHSHPNNFLSGVYFVRTAEGADTLNFHDPRSQTAIIRPAVTQLTADNTDQVVVKVKDGTLLLFPSWLAHSVEANQSAETRITISFNVMFSAYAENMSQPLWSATAPANPSR